MIELASFDLQMVRKPVENEDWVEVMELQRAAFPLKVLQWIPEYAGKTVVLLAVCKNQCI